MKKTIASITLALGVAALSFNGVAFAAVTCAQDDHKIFDQDSVTVIGCISDAAWQKAETERTARATQNLPIVVSGSVVTDEAGIAYQVPNMIYLPGWVDLTHTDEYRAQARMIAAQLNGEFGWAYWLQN